MTITFAPLEFGIKILPICFWNGVIWNREGSFHGNSFCIKNTLVFYGRIGTIYGKYLVFCESKCIIVKGAII